MNNTIRGVIREALEKSGDGYILIVIDVNGKNEPILELKLFGHLLPEAMRLVSGAGNIISKAIHKNSKGKAPVLRIVPDEKV